MAQGMSNGEAEILLVSFIVTLIFVGVLSWLTPALTRRDLFFGVSVAPNAREAPAARRVLRRYRLAVVVLTLVGCVGLWLLLTFGGVAWIESGWFVAAFLVAVLLPEAPYLFAHWAVRRLAQADPAIGAIPGAEASARAPAAALVPRRYGDMVPWFWEALPLLVIAATAGYLIVTYAQAPAIIPIHFGLNGQPNGYAAKSVGTYFIALWTQLFLEVLITGLAVLSARGKAQPDAADMRFRRRTLRFLYALKVLVLALLGAIGVVTARAALGQASAVGWLGILSLSVPVLVLVGVLGLALTTGQGGSRLAGASPVDRTDDRYWWLGAIYHNADDPSILVERRFGYGWTLNFGNRWSQFILLLLVLMLAASIFLPALLHR